MTCLPQREWISSPCAVCSVGPGEPRLRAMSQPQETRPCPLDRDDRSRREQELKVLHHRQHVEGE